MFLVATEEYSVKIYHKYAADTIQSNADVVIFVRCSDLNLTKSATFWVFLVLGLSPRRDTYICTTTFTHMVGRDVSETGQMVELVADSWC